jgi:putative FmdB family regulatory protein
MPIYDYQCRSCGTRVEVIHGLYDEGPQACDVCGGHMVKLLSPPAIVFKGSGWAKKERAASSAGSRDGKGQADAEKSDSTAKPEPVKTEKPSRADGGERNASGSKSSAADGGHTAA